MTVEAVWHATSDAVTRPIVRAFTIGLLATLTVSCASPGDLLSRNPPDFVVPLPGSTDPRALSGCVEAKLVEADQGAGLQHVDHAGESLLIAPLPGVFGPQGAVWAARFLPDRVEISGRASIRGRWGRDLPPIIRACQSET